MSNKKMILVKNDEGIEFYLSEDYNSSDLEKCQKKSVEMMAVVVDIFEKHKIDYVLAHGTLLGLIRHNGFIPWDDDCDLFVFDWDYARAIELLRRELPDDMIVHNRRTDPIYWPKWTKIRDLYSDTYESLWAIDRKFRYHGICIDILKVTVMSKAEYLNSEKIKKLKGRIERRKARQQKSALLKRLVKAPRSIAGGMLDQSKLHKLEKEIETSDEKICVGNKDTIIECSFDMKDVFPVKKMNFLGVDVAVPNNPDGVLRSMYGDYMTLPKLEDRKPHFDKVVFLDRDKGEIKNDTKYDDVKEDTNYDDVKDDIDDINDNNDK